MHSIKWWLITIWKNLVQVNKKQSEIYVRATQKCGLWTFVTCQWQGQEVLGKLMSSHYFYFILQEDQSTMHWKLNYIKNKHIGTSLVAQWLKIRLPMQGTRVLSLVREDPTGRRATKPVHHNYWACALEPASHQLLSPCPTTTEALVPRARALQQEKPPQWRVDPARRN